MAQFVTLPPLDRIGALLQQATGCKFIVDAMWKTWTPLPSSVYEWLHPYIRPCHQTILNETIAGTQHTPLALLRQLLRPYDYRIEAGAGSWTLKHGKPEKGVRVQKTPTTILWSDN